MLHPPLKPHILFYSTVMVYHIARFTPYQAYQGKWQIVHATSPEPHVLFYSNSLAM